jgi:hypothetical protein
MTMAEVTKREQVAEGAQKNQPNSEGTIGQASTPRGPIESTDLSDKEPDASVTSDRPMGAAEPAVVALAQPNGTADDSAETKEPKAEKESSQGDTTEVTIRILGSEVDVTFLLKVLIGAAIALVVGSTWILDSISKSKLPIGTKHILIVLYWVGLVGIPLLAVLVWQRKNSAVQKAYTLLLMLAVVGGGVILPIFYLAQVDRTMVLKLGAIAVLSMLPGLLYLQFIAAKGQTLRDEYVLNLHRLSIDAYESLPTPGEDSIFYRGPKPARDEGAAPDENLYIRKFEALYGRPVKGGQYTLPTGNRLLLVLATLVLAVGWATVLQPEFVLGRHLAYVGKVTLNGRPLLPLDALRFGFAGSYFFVLQMVIRRYFQDDLKPSAYLTALQRVIVVALLVTAIHQVWQWSATQEAAFAFLVGVFPDSAFKALIELLAVPVRPFVHSLDKPFPLSDLDGMNIWYESRLVEEGIEDMQSLATANLVDVILRTRVPLDRLIDWVDQSHLLLHVDGEKRRDNSHETSDRQSLRAMGIRTATDLVDALQPCSHGQVIGNKREAKEDPFVRKLKRALNHGRPSEWPSVTESIARALGGEPNLYYVRQWKTYPDRTRDAEKRRDRLARMASMRPQPLGADKSARDDGSPRVSPAASLNAPPSHPNGAPAPEA